MNNDKMNEDAADTPGSRRRTVVGVGLLAALAGAGLAWWRFTPREEEAGAQDAFWALRLETLEGQAMALAQWRGRPLLVNFWATWCPPCIEELPLLDAFHAENSPNGWQVIGLAVDQASSVRNFLTKTPLRFPVLMAGATGSNLSKSLGNMAGGLPFTVVFDANGRIHARKIGKVTPADLAAWRLLK